MVPEVDSVYCVNAPAQLGWQPVEPADRAVLAERGERLIAGYRYGCRPGHALSFVAEVSRHDCRECAV